MAGFCRLTNAWRRTEPSEIRSRRPMARNDKPESRQPCEAKPTA
jgi:hypothetical protein